MVASLVVTGLNKSYSDHRVLRDLSLEVAAGAIHGLVGLNGSGKTTTLECLLGLQSFESGSISILDHSPAQLHRLRGRVVGIFDTPSLNPNLTVRQALQQAALLCDPVMRSPQEVERLLGIERFSGFRIRQLSLGNKRRASIAQALLGDPDLVILDEPFNGLDAGGVDDVLALIQQLNRQHGTTFLLSSHQLPYLERICSHIAILHRGVVVSSDSTANLLRQSDTRLLVKTEAMDAARDLIAAQSGLQLQQADEDGYLHLVLQDTDSAQVNRKLVENDIPVQELILQRASLDSLFRELTRERPEDQAGDPTGGRSSNTSSEVGP